MASHREQVLEALACMIVKAAPGALVERNMDKPERIPDGGLVNILDGDLGDPETTLNPVSYSYGHMVMLEIAVQGASKGARTEALDKLLVAIGRACEVDRTLGGLTEWLEPQAPTIDDAAAVGAASIKWADVGLLAAYTTTNPLT
jgi:hypothetical protein